MIIVVDIGNTRIKWARAHENGLSDRGSALLAVQNPLAALGPALTQREGTIVASNVAGESVENDLLALARSHGMELTLIKPSAQQLGVRCAYADPARLGADRWVGVIAAHLLIAGPACVIDAGTTVTLDVVTAEGSHLGGLIMAGPTLIAETLGRATRGIGSTVPAEAEAEGLALLGTSTTAAVANGAMVGIAAGLDRAVAEVSDALGASMTVVLTGGGASTLKPWLKTAVSYRPDFMLEGLARIAAEL